MIYNVKSSHRLLSKNSMLTPINSYSYGLNWHFYSNLLAKQQYASCKCDGLRKIPAQIV